MISNYYTLKHIADDLNVKISNFEITEVFSQYKNELMISLHEDEIYFTLQISIDSASNFILLREQVKRAKNNSVDLFPQLMNKRISKVSINPSDRIIEIYFEDSGKLIITFFRGEGNIYLVNPNNLVTNAFKKAKETVGKEFHVEKRDFNISKYLRSSDELQNSLRITKEKNIVRSFNKVLPILGTIITKEIIFRSKIDQDNNIFNLTNIDLNMVWQKFKEVYNELNNPKVFVYYEYDRPIEFSIINLKQLNKLYKKEFDNVHEAISTFLFKRKAEKSKINKSEEVLKKIDNEIIYITSSISKLEKELEKNRAEEYQRYGDFIMSNLSEIKEGSEEIEIEDKGERIKILLDSSVTLIQNAAYYFEKSKKAREAKRISEKRLSDSILKVKILSDMHQELKNATDSNDFNLIFANHKKDLESYGITKTEEEQKELTLFRRFIVEGGFEVLCGKNSENNDTLTMRYAKPDDLWFHARGAGGSHVVLKVGSGKGEVSKKAINQAASIAAYYSQAKGASMAPVVMAKKKYVRKPKGANAGTVNVIQEKVIFVEPRLPEQ